MKKSLLTAVLMVFLVSAFAQPGVLDQTFGNNGKVYMPVVPQGYLIYPVDIKIQPDQKILALVMMDTAINQFWYSPADVFFRYQLLRFNPDGTPDSSFGTNGSTPIVAHERPTNMQLLANGQILLNTAVSNITTPSFPVLTNVDLCLTRYNANGTIDNSFGVNGRAVTPVDTCLSVAISVFVLPNGKIIQAGMSIKYTQVNPLSYYVLVGYDQNGNIDLSFGNAGKVKVRAKRYMGDYYGVNRFDGFTIPHSYLILSNQKIVATADSGLFRFNSNGSLDASFGTNGFRNYPPAYYASNPPVTWGLSETPVIAGVVDANDKMVFVMRRASFGGIAPNAFPLVACRFNPDGSPDSSFQTFILERDNTSTPGTNSSKIFLEPNGQYSIAWGRCYSGGYNGSNTQLIKLNSDGSADNSYGKRGRIVSRSDMWGFPFAYRIGMMGNAAALQPDGKMVVAGIMDTITFVNNYGTWWQKAWVIHRYEKNAKRKYNTLVSDVFYDQNSNGIKDGNETPFNAFHTMTTIKPGADTTMWCGEWPTYNNGLQDVDTGTYHSSVNLYYHPYYKVVPAFKTTSHSTYWNTDTLSFAVQKIANVRDLSVTVFPLSNAKPGFPIRYLIKVHNAGTDSAGNVVVRLVKSNKMVYDSATITASSVVGDTIIWNMGGIQSLHDAFIFVHGKVKAPPAANLGDTLQAIANVSSDKADTLIADNTSYYTQFAVGAWDPNDKKEAHAGKIKHAKAISGEYLTYTIRFQNTGNDTAFNVYIRDTMDSKLDWNSLQIVASSHNYKMTMNDGRCLFTFPSIMLVDSIKNEAKSHGYIVYKIKAKPNVQIGDVIENTAAIYFDYNLPIFTNTEMTTVVAEAFPLHLLSFTAKKNGKANLLNWSTTNEINVDRFEVERSPNGRDFSKIGITKANSTNQINTYQYSDAVAPNTPLWGAGGLYYRLKMIDRDGQFTYSPIRSLTINNSSLIITLFPNPAKDKVTVTHPIANANAQLQLTDMAGRILRNIKVSNSSVQTSMNLKGLPAGKYNITWSNGVATYTQTLVID